jgi:hypothetical protein
MEDEDLRARSSPASDSPVTELSRTYCCYSWALTGRGEFSLAVTNRAFTQS